MNFRRRAKMKAKHLALCLVAFAVPAGLAQLARSADIPERGGMEIEINLPLERRCQAYGPPIRTVIAVTQIQDWCDPGNRNLLQVDVFVKLANGSKGSYLFSNVDIPCNHSSVPTSVRTLLCPP
jgi:hypothetical protein